MLTSQAFVSKSDLVLKSLMEFTTGNRFTLIVRLIFDTLRVGTLVVSSPTGSVAMGKAGPILVPFPRPTVRHRAAMWGKSLLRRQRDLKALEIKLYSPTGSTYRPLATDEMPIVFLVHNDVSLLPSFFAHYRAMGVTRFICVDDQSDDGSREFLLAQADADVYASDVRYREAARGKYWRELLFDKYGYDRWYLNVDCDEFLVYESMHDETIANYAQRLQRRNIRRLPAPMLDLYPVGPLEQAVLVGTDRQMPWHVATHFDSDNYTARVERSAWSLKGGVRSRVFGTQPELMKYPLTFWDRRSMLRTIHRPLPAAYNFAPVHGCLLHFKIFADFRHTVSRAVEDGQYFNDSEVYRTILDRLDSPDRLNLKYAGSVAYTGVKQLIERRFIQQLKSERRAA